MGFYGILEYVIDFATKKVQASGWPDESWSKLEKDAWLKEYAEMGIFIDPEKLADRNEGMRYIAKQYLNALWGNPH